jgi:hypothetical protein
MEFTELYKTFKPEPIDILLKNGSVHTGSGGSDNYIIVNGEQVLKIIPNRKKYWNEIHKKKNDQEEIKFYNYFTQHLLLKNKTPHIVGSYESIKINLKTLIDKYHKYCIDNNDSGNDKLKTKFELLMTKYDSNMGKDKKMTDKQKKNFIYKLLNFFKFNSKKTQKANSNTTKNSNSKKPLYYKTLKANVKKSLCNFKINKCGPVMSMVKINTMLDGIYLESCTETISNYFNNVILNDKLRISKSDSIDNIAINCEMFINRVIFQYSFTMCAIYTILPTYIHNDMFLRNIMARVETKYTENDFIEYICKNESKNNQLDTGDESVDDMIFYLPANGICIKINDFGYSLALPDVGDKILHKDFLNRSKCVDQFTKYQPNMTTDNSHNSDTFNFLHDLYDGANMGQDSLMTLIKNNTKIENKVKIIHSIKNTIKHYLDIDIIDKINKINKKKLNRVWNINTIPELEATIKHPMYYLKNNFKMFSTKPINANIVKTYKF